MTQTITIIVTIIGSGIGLITLILGLLEYSRQGSLKRAEHFLNMRKRLKEDPLLRRISQMIHDRDSKLLELTLEEKLYFTGFFEEIAILMNSGLIRPEVTHYMFGYYAIRCWESELFWANLNRDTPYWSVLRDFIKSMKQIESSFRFRRRNFRL